MENNIPQVPSSISYEQALVVGGCALVVGYLTYDFYTGGPLSSSIFSTNTLTHNYNMQNSSFHSGAVKSVLNSTLTHETLVSNNLDEMPVLQVLCPDLLNDPNVFNCTTSKSIEKDLFAMNKMSVEEPIL